ncbi:MAG: VOC family protein, partial [Alphaproteobacteria bacterium]|nr:VOC family protein [Alphaproteobacteria bacterium]
DYHHDIAVFKVADDAAPPEQNQVGLSHLALVADSLETVKAMYRRLKEHDVPIVRTVDHGVTKSVYFKDPEGNELEIYCDVPEKPWQEVDTMIKAEHIDLDTRWRRSWVVVEIIELEGIEKNGRKFRNDHQIRIAGRGG